MPTKSIKPDLRIASKRFVMELGCHARVHLFEDISHKVIINLS